MIDFKFEVKGAKEVQKFALQLAGKMPDVIYFSQINTAERIVERIQQEMRSRFKRPKPWVIKSLRMANRQGNAVGKTIKRKNQFTGKSYRVKQNNFDVFVDFKEGGKFGSGGQTDSAVDLMWPHVHGGPRPPKASERRLRRQGVIGADEYIVPSRTAPLDKWGNIRPGVMTKILSDLQAFTNEGFSANRNLKTAGSNRFFIATINGQKAIFQGSGGTKKSFGAKLGGKINMVFLIVKGAPRYPKRIKFYELSQQTYVKNIERQFNRVFDREVAKLARA